MRKAIELLPDRHNREFVPFPLHQAGATLAPGLYAVKVSTNSDNRSRAAGVLWFGMNMTRAARAKREPLHGMSDSC
jgi:hypothetical protein